MRHDIFPARATAYPLNILFVISNLFIIHKQRMIEPYIHNPSQRALKVTKSTRISADLARELQ